MWFRGNAWPLAFCLCFGPGASAVELFIIFNGLWPLGFELIVQHIAPETPRCTRTNSESGRMRHRLLQHQHPRTPGERPRESEWRCCDPGLGSPPRAGPCQLGAKPTASVPEAECKHSRGPAGESAPLPAWTHVWQWDLSQAKSRCDLSLAPRISLQFLHPHQ